MQELQEKQVRFLGQKDPLKEGMATHSSIPAWRNPWTEEPGGLQSIGSANSRAWLKRCSMHAHTNSSVCVCVCVCARVRTRARAQSLSHVQLFVTPWTGACQAPISLKIFKQEYWTGLPFPTPGDLPDQGIEPASLASPALSHGFFITAPPVAGTKITYPFYSFNPSWVTCLK